jgi:chromosome condensin MukBEF complex kleisin-like MukF subunit
MREDRFFNHDEIKSALSKVHDALGVNYTRFSEVIETLDDMRLDFRPTMKETKIVEAFRKRTEDLSMAMNPVEFWAVRAKNCINVVEAVRLYLEANAHQYPGATVIKNRILFLANKGAWK